MKLSKIERYKKELLPADFEDKLANLDYANVDEQIRFYLKNFGIYNIKLKPNVYMLRIRVDGGKISPHQLLEIANIAKDENLSIIITSRAQIELHHIKPDRVYSIYSKIKSLGIDTYQTLTDNFRAIVTDPLDEIPPYSKIAVYPIIEQIRERILHKREWIGLIPRKFNTAIIGVEYPNFNPWGNDLLMALSQKDDRLGFNIYLGGKNSEVAKSADIFIQANKAVDIFMAIAQIYKEFGLRESRSKARLFHLIESMGMDKIRDLISKYYPYSLESEGKLLMRSSNISKELKDIEIRGGFYGEFSANEIIEIAKEAKELKLSPEQSIYIINKKGFKIKEELKVTACAGARYCPLSLWDIKRDVELLPIDRLREFNISIGFSGCLKGCGRHYHSDIGLIGLRTNLYAPTERAGRVYIGATQDPKPSPAIMLFYSVPLRCLNDLIEMIIDDFKYSGYERFEEFSSKVLRAYDLETLQLRYALKREFNTKKIIETFLKRDSLELIATIYSLYEIDSNTPLTEALKEITHRSWDKR